MKEEIALMEKSIYIEMKADDETIKQIKVNCIKVVKVIIKIAKMYKSQLIYKVCNVCMRVYQAVKHKVHH